MKVLMINGSPNEKGSTFTALSAAEKILNENGVETEIISIGKEVVRGCIACRWCRKGNDRCVFNDDIVNTVIEKAKEADGFIFGSPVYFANVNGSMLSLLGRAFFAGGKNFAFKPAAGIVAARRGGTTAALEEINKFIMYNHMPLVPSNYWNMIHGSNAEQVVQDEEGMQTMEQLGRNMFWMLSKLQGSKPETVEKTHTNFIR